MRGGHFRKSISYRKRNYRRRGVFIVGIFRYSEIIAE
jgi:hypothetical protein